MKIKFRSNNAQFKNKKEAFGTFLAYLSAPWFLALGILLTISKSRLSENYTEAQMRQVYLFGLASVALVLIYSWCKMFRIFFIMNSKDYDALPDEPDIPETAICSNCREPFAGNKLTTLKCPKCGGTLENLIGFYDRHPELRNDNDNHQI